MVRLLKTRRWLLFKEQLPDWVEDGGQKILCLVGSHDPTRDNCGRPEHDFCLWCNKSMPGKWVP